MLVKTENIRENAKSIGMFSRHGKMTTVINSIFKNKDEKVKKDSSDLDFFSRLLDQSTTKQKEAEQKASTRLSSSFYFRATSREKAQGVRPKTPDVGQYHPRRELVESKTVFYSNVREKARASRNTARYTPNCIKSGAVCEYKARKIKKQIDELRTEINSANVDAELLYKNLLIGQDVYEMFKSPSLKFIKPQRSDQNRPGHKENNGGSTMRDDLDGTFKNYNSLISQVVTYTNLKAELKEILKKSQEEVINAVKIPEKLRSYSTSITPIQMQTARAAVGEPRYRYQELGLDISVLDYENNKASARINRATKALDFGKLTNRNAIFRPKETLPYFYDYDQWKATRSEKVKQVAHFKKMIARPEPRVYGGTYVDSSDLMSTFKKVHPKANNSVDMLRSTARNFSIPKEASPYGRLSFLEGSSAAAAPSRNNNKSINTVRALNMS